MGVSRLLVVQGFGMQVSGHCRGPSIMVPYSYTSYRMMYLLYVMPACTGTHAWMTACIHAAVDECRMYAGTCAGTHRTEASCGRMDGWTFGGTER